MRSGFIDKLIERIRRVQPEEVQNYLVRLAQEKGFLERIFDALQEGVIVTDMQGKIQFLNSAAQQFFAVDDENVLGRPFTEVLRGLDWLSLRSMEGTVSRDIEIFYPHHRCLNCYVTPLHLDDHQPGSKAALPGMVGHVIILRDITEDRKTAERTIENEKLSALTLLAAGVAHEIGNPLNSLNIHLQLIDRRLRRVPEEVRGSIQELLDVAKGEIRRLDSIVQQFLRAIRPTSPQFVSADINEILKETVSFIRAEIQDRDILVEMDLAPDLPKAEVDRDQLKQAFYNLIKNAVQAMRAGGILHIRSWWDDAYVSVTFADTGGGISPENMSKLFRPYYTTKAGGSGLGLLIVRRIVREHGGEIEIESNEGKGVQVTVHLPHGDKRVRLLGAGGSQP
jgi:two-component system, sporulation sensor kinase E